MSTGDDLTDLPADLRAELEALLPEPADFPACFAFSQPKCGSTMLTNGIRYILEAERLPGFHFPRFFWDRGVPPIVWSRFDLREYYQDGVVYYGFRSMPRHLRNSDILANRRSIFLIRDLRDALTSHYFSKAFEHPAPGGGGEFAERFRAEKIATQERAIDDHVLEHAPKMLRSWQIYMSSLPTNAENNFVFRYEDIIYRKTPFFKEIFDIFRIPLKAGVLQSVVSRLDIFPDKENVKQRIRSVKPGNHREKLNDDTISTLNDILSEHLRKHRYIIEN